MRPRMYGSTEMKRLWTRTWPGPGVGHRHLDNGEVTVPWLATRSGDEMNLSATTHDYRLCHHLRRVSRHRPLPKTSTSTTTTTMISIASQMLI